MTKEMYLYLLFPYAVFLILGIIKLRFTLRSSIILSVITSIAVWALLYAAYNFAEVDLKQAFVTVEEIMKENDYDWLLRFSAENLGWLIGFIYFWLCWGTAWLFFNTKEHTDEN